MRPGDVELASNIAEKLKSFAEESSPLPGIDSQVRLRSLTAQIIDSVRRIKYVVVIRDKEHSSIYANPLNKLFDPLKAAAWHKQQGNYNEAFWLVFLLTHFGKNRKTAWTLVREVYKADENSFWTWKAVSADFNSFRNWLHLNQNRIKELGNFGNHRKYQSLDAYSPTGTGMAIGSYIEWTAPELDHLVLINKAVTQVGNNQRELFQYLYDSMNHVISFGRTAKFDYLTMLGKLEIAPIEPPSTYMSGATGPKAGARLLFGNSTTANLSEVQLNVLLNNLESHLGLYFGMQVLEDALCNWQKNPDRYQPFRG